MLRRAAIAALLAADAWFLWDALANYRLWQEWVETDPSGAELYWTNVQIDLAGALFCAILAGVLAALGVRTRKKRKGDPR